MSLTKIIYIIIFIPLLCSCTYLDNLSRESVVITKQIEVGEINKLIVDCPYLIELTNATSSSIKLEGQEHLIADVNYQMQDKVLTLKHDKSDYIQHHNRPIIYIPTTKLNSIVINSIVNVYSKDTIIIDHLSIKVNGRGSQSNSDILMISNNVKLGLYGSEHIGNHQLKGQSKNLSIVSEGATNILAGELEVKTADVIHKSFGACTVNATEQLNVTIYSTGDTFYYGKPKVNSKVVETPSLKASGKVYSMN